MNSKQWQAVMEARELLELPEKATLAEIKKAYRRMSKKYHPDTSTQQGLRQDVSMDDIIGAYQVLHDYCTEYSFPLAVADGEKLEAEDWWLDRFGQDPLWGKQKGS